MKEQKKFKDNKKVLKIAIICLAVILLILIFLLYKNRNTFVGSWTTDGNTVYEFKLSGKGALKVPLGEYRFKYKIGNKKLYIDFDNEKSKDAEYKYHFEKGKLVLEGENGTFKFTKKKNK